MFGSDLAGISCPYCGEPIEVVVDLSEPLQEYVEDCSVCCRPILLTVRVDGSDAVVEVRREDD